MRKKSSSLAAGFEGFRVYGAGCLSACLALDRLYIRQPISLVNKFHIYTAAFLHKPIISISFCFSMLTLNPKSLNPKP